MNQRLTWKKLLCEERVRESESSKSTNYHNEFDKDYSRIVYSSSVRRLQDKAQVFPMQENDFTRTRLTHSIEVASLGKSLAWGIGDWLMKRGALEDVWEIKKLASMVETACLIHDLGNPPFGHYGEDVIRNWFEKWFDSKEYENLKKQYMEDEGIKQPLMNEQQECDFLFFEGNAQGIRILTKLQILNDRNGANLTFGTLATLIKYPWYSNDVKCKGKKKEKYEVSDEDKGKKKLGCFYSEREIIEQIKEKVGIAPHRHPATLILEAADDIAYLPTDIEDAIKKGALQWEVVYDALEDKIKDYDDEKSLNSLKKRIKDAEDNKVPDLELVKVQNLKITLQGIFIKEVKNTFIENYEKIMNGTFEGALLDKSKAINIVKACKDISYKHIFCNSEILSLELIGDRVITDLLDLFVPAVISIKDCNSSKRKEQKLYQLISENFRYVQSFDKETESTVEFNTLTLYEKLQLVTDFISGMTDTYAVNLHQKLLGTKMP